MFQISCPIFSHPRFIFQLQRRRRRQRTAGKIGLIQPTFRYMLCYNSKSEIQNIDNSNLNTRIRTTHSPCGVRKSILLSKYIGAKRNILMHMNSYVLSSLYIYVSGGWLGVRQTPTIPHANMHIKLHAPNFHICSGICVCLCVEPLAGT